MRLPLCYLGRTRLACKSPRVPGMILLGMAIASLLWLQSDFAAAKGVPRSTVQMVIDYGDGAELRLTALPWRAGMTVLDAIEAVGAHPHGVKFKLRGSGSTAFVTQIGDTKNEGGGAGNQNWTYKVDDEEADVGVGSCELKTGSVILWKFAPADYNQ